jgi:type I restriction enzyme S subunit
MASGEVQQGQVTRTKETITERGLASSNIKVFPPGTVMIALNGQGRTRGTVAVLRIPAACNQSLAALTALPSMTPDFLFHSLNARYKEMRALTGHENRSGLNLGLIRDLPLLLPPLQEQREITDVLTAIDEAIGKTGAVVEAAEHLREALVHELLTRGMPGRHSEWKNVPGLGTIPIAWEFLPLGALLQNIEAGSSPRCLTRPANQDEWGVLKVSSVSWGEFRPNENKALPPRLRPDRAAEVRAGDLLVSRANTPDLVGRAVYVTNTRPRLLLSDKTWRLVPRPEVDPRFLGAVLTLPSSRCQVVGSATGTSKSMRNISQGALRLVRVPVPPFEEQARIADSIGAVSKLILSSREILFALQGLKGAAAGSLLTGSMRVLTGSMRVLAQPRVLV